MLDAFIKPLTVISNAIAQRLHIWLRRKPKLHVHFHPNTGVWAIGTDGTNKIMQVGFQADFTHDDPSQTLILVDAFPEGTQATLHFRESITIEPEMLVTPEYQIWMMVTPVVEQEGKNWTGQIIFVDQFKRKYKSKERFEFRWGGGSSNKQNTPDGA